VDNDLFRLPVVKLALSAGGVCHLVLLLLLLPLGTTSSAECYLNAHFFNHNGADTRLACKSLTWQVGQSESTIRQ
jgi:hypothetical protein